jgi:hypothetical protein
MITEITERRRGILERIGLFGLSKVDVPDVVNLRIDQPKGVKLDVTGPKSNCQVCFYITSRRSSF